MTSDQQIYWDKIEHFELDDPDAALTFSERLARENGWSMQYTLRCIQEYKRFIFLICVIDHPLTPSDEIDQVWHLHLLYTQSYWIDFCQHTLGKQIHHGPTKGGEKEQNKFTDWYAKTKESYKRLFDEDTPDDIWPDSTIRFSTINFQRINTDQYWLIKKPFK